MSHAMSLLDDARLWTLVFSVIVCASLLAGFIYAWFATKKADDGPKRLGDFRSFCMFFYASFLKPHTGDGRGHGQQDALESFYKGQATVYDATRKRLLRGREDMLGLVAAQLAHRAESKAPSTSTKPVWVDIGGGTGYNIEAMAAYLPVPDFFSAVYLVDLSPSLCEIARQRFGRLGWKNVHVVCQDARSFRLEPDEAAVTAATAPVRSMSPPYRPGTTSGPGRAQLVTLSYALSMIPEFYSVIDSFTSLLAPAGVIGVVDFYVQSIVDVAGRNYTGGVFNRHVNWLGRVFWRAWFEVDRVGLEAARRDYLEYRYGTILSVDDRNYLLGGIPYYIWVGCRKELCSRSEQTLSGPGEVVERLDAAATESPYLVPVEDSRRDLGTTSSSSSSSSISGAARPGVRSKAYESAIVNLTSNLPLPAFFYQNHHWRLHYDDQLRKHTQFNNEYIYAFTWEDARADQRLLGIGEDDVILALTSAGDNILAYALESPRRIHAVDLNPTQNHLLELKVAAFAALGQADVWKLFGEGKHSAFRQLLVSRLSPHLSSRAFQYWLDHASTFTRTSGHGLYESGGSRHAIRLARWLFRVFGLTQDVRSLCQAKTLNEQREIWHHRIRRVLLNQTLSRAVIATDGFLWKALGVPLTQRSMIETDFAARTSSVEPGKMCRRARGQAIWEYMVNTFDPVLENTLIGDDNYFYLLCTQGSYSERCSPPYLSARAYTKLSRPKAFDGLRIHTDELQEVIARIMPGTLTIAVIMDSMDWFELGSPDATRQITALNDALEVGGRVLLRSAGIHPWYMDTFANLGFTTRRVAARHPGACIDRVNMYASTWICSKTHSIRPTPKDESPPQDGVQLGREDLASPEALEL